MLCSSHSGFIFIKVIKRTVRDMSTQMFLFFTLYYARLLSTKWLSVYPVIFPGLLTQDFKLVFTSLENLFNSNAIPIGTPCLVYCIVTIGRLQETTSSDASTRHTLNASWPNPVWIALLVHVCLMSIYLSALRLLVLFNFSAGPRLHFQSCLVLIPGFRIR